MASYNARIDLDVRINKALSQIKKVEGALDRLSGIASAGKEFKEALVPDVKAFKTIERELSNIKNRANSTAKVFARIFEGVSTAGVAGAGLQALNAEMFKLAQSTGTAAASIQQFDKSTGDLARLIPGFNALKDSVGFSAREINKLQFNLQSFLNSTEGLREFVDKFYTIEGAAGAATAGLLALAGVLEGQLRQSLGDIERVSSRALGGLAEDAAKGTSELQRLIRATQGTANQYRNLIQVGEERRDAFNSASREARQATNTIVQAEKKLTDELRAQADLKRQAKGITVAELEATKGRKSIQTRINAEDFRLKQLSEEEAVYQAIARLNERDVTALQEKLNIQRNITNQASLEAQRRESATERAATGLSRQIPTPYRTAGSMGFPIALPEIAQDRRIQAAKAARESAQAALEQQKVNSILVKGVTVLKTQVAIAKQLDGVYDNIVTSLRRANERQGQLTRAKANRAERKRLGDVSVKLLQEINNLSTGINQKESIKNRLLAAGVKIKNNEFDSVKRIQREVRELIKAEDARINRARRLVKFRQNEAKAAKQSRSQRRENLLLGAGFPLVTGGGVGSILGGAAGALLQKGGGFGLGVFLSGIGQKLDQFVQSQSQVASSIQESTDVFGTLESAGFKVSGSLKAVVQRLEEIGDTTGAYRLKLRELQKAYGANAVRDLNNFDRANQRISDSFKRLTATLFPPLIRLFTAISYITSAAVDNIAKFFEVLAGQSAGGGRARPDVRLEGEFAQAGAFERELASRPLVTREEQALSTFKQSRFFQQYEKDQKTLKENQSIVDNINRRQKQAQQERQEAANKIRRIELQRNQLAVDRARIESDSLRNQLRLQSQIRQTEIDIEVARTKGARAYAAARLAIARQNVEDLKLGRELFAPRGGETAFSEIDLAAGFSKELVKTDVDNLVKALTDANIFSTEYITNVATRFKKAKFAAIDITAEEEKRLFITKDAAYQKRTDLINAEVSILNAATEEEANRLRLIQLQNEAREQAKQEGITDPTLIEKRVQAVTAKFAAQNKKVSELSEFITQSTKELENLEAVGVRVAQGIGDAIGNSLANGVTQLIEGSATVKEVFSDLLKSVGQILVQEGTKMIATYIAIGIAKAFAGLGGSGNTSFGGNGVGQGQLLAPVSTGSNANSLLSSFLKPRAIGGPVGRNGAYLVGEQGPELFTPNQAGRISSTSDTRSLLGRSPVGQGAPAMNFTFETTNIGGKEFVDREQLEAAMAVTRRQAASDGAKKGMGMTLDKMQHSPATRRRVGIS